MQGDSLLPELRDMEQRGDDVAAWLVIDQNLPLIRPLADLARPSAWVFDGVQQAAERCV